MTRVLFPSGPPSPTIYTSKRTPRQESKMSNDIIKAIKIDLANAEERKDWREVYRLMRLLAKMQD